MRACYLILPLLVCALWAVPVPGVADTLPTPTIWRDSGSKPFSTKEFEHVLQQLKTERAALESEWKALVKRSAAGTAPGQRDRELAAQLKDMLERLQQSRSPTPAAPKELDINSKKIEPLPVGPSKTQETPPPLKTDGAAIPVEEPVDPISEAHSLFRARRFEEALASFRQVDLKGKKAEARAPVQYLMAICLLHLGKTDEATALFRDVANSRGDEKLASYAQWQLELLRWQRDVQEKLQGHRERRLALEKKI
jgi:TolA-binding protein